MVERRPGAREPTRMDIRASRAALKPKQQCVPGRVTPPFAPAPGSGHFGQGLFNETKEALERTANGRQENWAAQKAQPEVTHSVFPPAPPAS
jgi:hypothetical protein